METKKLMAFIEEKTKELQETIGHLPIEIATEGKIEENFSDHTFDGEKLEVLQKEGKIPLFSLVLTHKSEGGMRYYVDLCAEGILFPLFAEDKTDLIRFSIHFGEWEEGDMDVEYLIVEDGLMYREMLNVLFDTVTHQFAVFTKELQQTNA